MEVFVEPVEPSPELLDVAPWPYVVLGAGYAALAVGLLIAGAQRQRELERAMNTGDHVPLQFRTVAVFTESGSSFEVPRFSEALATAPAVVRC